MGPTLSVEGKKLEIVVVGVKAKGSDNTQYFYDAKSHSFMDDNQKIDLLATIENPSKIQQFIDRLEMTIDESVDYLIQLKLQIADAFLNDTELPFPGIELKPIVEEVKGQVSFIEGLENALEIAKGKLNIDSEVSSTE